MKLSTIKKISVFGLFGMSFLTHFIYNIFPNPLFAIFFPVNESIWEHMKLLSTTILLYGIIEYFLLKHYNIKVNNFLFSLFIMSVISIPIYLIIFLPFYYIYSHRQRKVRRRQAVRRREGRAACCSYKNRFHSRSRRAAYRCAGR